MQGFNPTTLMTTAFIEKINWMLFFSSHLTSRNTLNQMISDFFNPASILLSISRHQYYESFAFIGSVFWFIFPAWMCLLIYYFCYDLIHVEKCCILLCAQELSPTMLVVLITPPPIDEDGRKEHARFVPFFPF